MKKYLCLVSLAGLLSVSMLCVGADAVEIGNANAIESMVAQNRNIRFNGKPLTASGLATLQQLESYFGTQLADGTYWYDARTGAFGNWGGPTVGFLGPGSNLAGPLPANASGGGTRVFIKGASLGETSDVCGGSFPHKARAPRTHFSQTVGKQRRARAAVLSVFLFGGNLRIKPPLSCLA